MEPKAHPRTTEQALQQQQADADRERAAKAAKQKATPRQPTEMLDRFGNGPAPQEVVPAAKRAVVPLDGRTSVQQYVDEIAPNSIAGRMVRFSKNGEFIFADTEEVIPPDQDWIALCDEVLIGWIRFHRDDETPPDRVQGLLYDGFVMPPRESLGDMDRSKWEQGLSGEPDDPWKHQNCLVLQSPGTHELATFVTTSRTGRRAVGNLLRHYDRMKRKSDEHYPVVRLKPSGFNHRDERIGWVPVPMFAVVGKAPKTSADIPDTSPSGDMDDQITF
jgi:hypothetical protein